MRIALRRTMEVLDRSSPHCGRSSRKTRIKFHEPGLNKSYNSIVLTNHPKCTRIERYYRERKPVHRRHQRLILRILSLDIRQIVMPGDKSTIRVFTIPSHSNPEPSHIEPHTSETWSPFMWQQTRTFKLSQLGWRETFSRNVTMCEINLTLIVVATTALINSCSSQQIIFFGSREQDEGVSGKICLGTQTERRLWPRGSDKRAKSCMPLINPTRINMCETPFPFQSTLRK